MRLSGKAIAVLLATLCTCLIAGGPAFTDQQVMTIGCQNADDFPSLIGDSDALAPGKPGATVEVLRLIEKQMGITIKIVRYPWARALESELKNGTIDGLFTASFKKERMAFGAYPMVGDQPDPTKSLYAMRYVFYRLKSTDIEWDGKGLKGFSGIIGAPRGYSIVTDLRNLGYTVDESDGTLQDLKMLAARRVNLAAGLELTGDVYLEKNPDLGKVIEKVEKPIATKDYYIMLSNQFVKANPAQAKRFWALVGEMQADYRRIAATYLSP